MDGYILQGTSGEYLLVVRSDEEQDIIHIIDRIAASRKKSVKELAVELEKSLQDDGSRRHSSEARSKDKVKSSNSNRGGRKKAVNSQHRS